MAILLLAVSPAWAAVSCAALASSAGSSNTDATSYATASVTLTANRLYVLSVVSETTTGPVNVATATSTGATWVGITSQGYNNDDTNGAHRIAALRTMVGSNQTGAVTIDFDSQTQHGAVWSITECTGVDTTGTNGSGAIVTSNKNVVTGNSSITLTFAAFSHADNRPIVATASLATSSTPLNDIEWTQFNEGFSDNAASLSTGWRDATDDTTMTHSTTGANTDWGGIGIEVKAAAAGAGTAGALVNGGRLKRLVNGGLVR